MGDIFFRILTHCPLRFDILKIERKINYWRRSPNGRCAFPFFGCFVQAMLAVLLLERRWPIDVAVSTQFLPLALAR